MKMKLSLLALMLLLVMPVLAQDDDAVDPTQLDLSGTPDAICEAATPAVEPENREFEAADSVLEAGVDYRAVLCTSAGAIYVDLFEDFTPVTVNNFVFLAESNYYNNTIFHRVIEDFMAQAGDPTGTGSGGPGYRFQDEFVVSAFERSGLLAMANSGPETNGSQFFITTAETPWLNGAHTVFGDVLVGQSETVDNILLRDPQAGGDATTLDTVVIIRDPEVIETTFEADPAELAAADDVVAGIDATLDGRLAPDMTYDGAEELTTDDVVALAPDELQEDYAAFLDDSGHAYRVTALLDNPECNADYFFYTMSYSVDAFGSAQDAATALDSEFLAEYYAEIGYDAYEGNVDLPYNVYFTEMDICDSTVQVATADIQRGRYIANVSAIFSLSDTEEDELANVAANLIPPLFETQLAPVFLTQVR